MRGATFTYVATWIEDRTLSSISVRLLADSQDEARREASRAVVHGYRLVVVRPADLGRDKQPMWAGGSIS